MPMLLSVMVNFGVLQVTKQIFVSVNFLENNKIILKMEFPSFSGYSLEET